MYTAILALALVGQGPAQDYDFIDLGKKVDSLVSSADRAERRLALVEEKINEVLDKLDTAVALPTATTASRPVVTAQTPAQTIWTTPSYVPGPQAVYTYQTPVRRGLFRRRMSGQYYSVSGATMGACASQ